MKRSKKTFKTILDQTADRNKVILMEKARLANRLAKSLKGRQKRQFYDVKVKSLLAVISKFWYQIELCSDLRIPDMIVVRTQDCGGLHIPRTLLPLRGGRFSGLNEPS